MYLQVGMGFGIHIGWAIEGAIGSKYKVDASYLSPNVNMSARLEAATHMYGVQLLLSEWFVGELSPEVMKNCRRLDKVTVKGSQVPMELWTFDISSFPSKI
jgi:class 3 adenylate cyclase